MSATRKNSGRTGAALAVRVPNIIEFCKDPDYLGIELSVYQEAFLRAFYALELEGDHYDAYRECTGRTQRPRAPYPEGTLIAGARGGKDSRILVPTISYEGVFGGHEKYLSRGERGVIPLVAPNQKLTKIAMQYTCDYFQHSPKLRQLIEDIIPGKQQVLQYEIRLVHGISYLGFPISAHGLRGYSNPAAGIDEAAFFPLEGQANADVEVVAAIRRGMLSFPNPRMIKVSTPWGRSGLIYDEFKRAWGQDDPDLLVWRASSLQMNPTLPTGRLEQARRADPVRFSREYGAEFSEDLSAFLSGQLIEDLVARGRLELEPRAGITYTMTGDPAGGGSDCFTANVLHEEDGRWIQDLLRGWGGGSRKTVDLDGIVAEVVAIARRYGCREIVGDRFGGQWVRQAFERHGLRYVDPKFTKSEAYLEAEAVFLQRRVELLDHPVLLRELKILERRPGREGRTRVDHPSGAHDDHANALCLGLAHAAKGVLAACDLGADPGAHGLGVGAELTPEEIRAFRDKLTGEATREDMIGSGFWGRNQARLFRR
jgi:hypothetical protein